MDVTQTPQAAFADFIAPRPGESPLARRGQPGDRTTREAAGPRKVTALDNRESTGALVSAADLQAAAADGPSARDRRLGAQIDVMA
ncbi:MAG: hypothetical protein O2782_00630 [bacterium]|nr:hypothetical protein [bacterium]